MSMKQLATRLVSGIHFTAVHGSALRVEIPSEWQQLAAAYLDICDQARAMPDDREPADALWGESVGAERDDTSGCMVLFASGVEIRFSRFLLFVEDTLCKRQPTRRDVRGICSALGYHLRERTAETVTEKQPLFEGM